MSARLAYLLKKFPRLSETFILNELLAFLDMAKLPAGALDDRSRLIMTYALSSFANFGSLGILIGGLGSLVPERRDEVVSLGMKALLAGTLATCLTAAPTRKPPFSFTIVRRPGNFFRSTTSSGSASPKRSCTSRSVPPASGRALPLLPSSATAASIVSGAS